MDKMNILCPHFSFCSGCIHDTDVANLKTYNEAKEFFLSLGVCDLKLHTGLACGWRCRAKIAVRGTEEEPLVGLFKANSHYVVDIPNCRVHHPLINEAVNHVRQWIKEYGIVPYNEKTGKGVLRYLELAVDRKLQRVQLALILNQRQDEALSLKGQKEAIENLWEAQPQLWHSLWLNFNKRRDNIILGDLWLKVCGEEWLWDEFCGRQVCFHPASFAQANPEMFEKLLVELKKKVPHGTHVVEFYAGGGVIGLTVLDQCKSLYCNEIVPLAEKCFNKAKERLPEQLKNKISFVCGPAEKQMDLLHSDIDLVILDPPRKGIDPHLLNRLCMKSSLKRLIYVSCGWKSFQKDCMKLLENSWKLSSADSFLFFPGSDHLEVLAIFDKEENV